MPFCPEHCSLPDSMKISFFFFLLSANLEQVLGRGLHTCNHRQSPSVFEGQKWDPSYLPADKAQKFDNMPLNVQTKLRLFFEQNGIDLRADGESVNWDNEGDVFYTDPPPQEETDVGEFPIDSGTNTQYPENAVAQDSGVPIYHSKPGARYTLYLDFDGTKFSGRAWGNGGSFDMKAYIRATDPNYVGNAWAIVAEDFAPWDVDVTTEEPLRVVDTDTDWQYDNNVGHVVITDQLDKNGNEPYPCGCGGVAYVNVFGRSDYRSRYTPAFVFNTSLKGVAEAISHEFGHNLGLSHDGTSSVGYYTGHGPDGGETEWAPIMGVGYYAHTAQWSKGEYPDANQNQDDLQIITGKMPYRDDDHTTVKPLSITGTEGYAEGIIERNTDFDTFSFYGSGNINVYINTRDNSYGNLHAGLKILNADNSDQVIATVEGQNARDQTWSGTLSLGNYKIQVYGIGKDENGADPGYSNYGSLGQYQVTVTGIEQIARPSSMPSSMPSSFTIPSQVPSLKPSSSPIASVCGDGRCNGGENCDTCLEDCGKRRQSLCGNGVCETGDGEDCVNCSRDCSGQTGGNPNDRYCCGRNTPCSDFRCVGANTCLTDSVAVLVCPSTEVCNDGVDNDLDGQIDCDDPDCAGNPSCQSSPEVCNDGQDNDLDGLVDCDDPDCAGNPSCTCVPSGGAEYQCYSNPNQCCSKVCHNKFNQCK